MEASRDVGVPFSFLLCSAVFLWFPMIIGAQTPLILAFSQHNWDSYLPDSFFVSEGTRQHLNPNPLHTGSFFPQEELSVSSLLWTSRSLLLVISWILLFMVNSLSLWLVVNFCVRSLSFLLGYIRRHFCELKCLFTWNKAWFFKLLCHTDLRSLF